MKNTGGSQASATSKHQATGGKSTNPRPKQLFVRSTQSQSNDSPVHPSFPAARDRFSQKNKKAVVSSAGMAPAQFQNDPRFKVSAQALASQLSLESRASQLTKDHQRNAVSSKFGSDSKSGQENISNRASSHHGIPLHRLGLLSNGTAVDSSDIQNHFYASQVKAISPLLQKSSHILTTKTSGETLPQTNFNHASLTTSLRSSHQRSPELGLREIAIP